MPAPRLRESRIHRCPAPRAFLAPGDGGSDEADRGDWLAAKADGLHGPSVGWRPPGVASAWRAMASHLEHGTDPRLSHSASTTAVTSLARAPVPSTSVRRVRCFVGCFTVAVSVVAGLKSAEEPVGQACQVRRVETPVTIGFTPVVSASLRHQAHSSQRFGRVRDTTPLPEGCQIGTLTHAAMSVRGAADVWTGPSTSFAAASPPPPARPCTTWSASAAPEDQADGYRVLLRYFDDAAVPVDADGQRGPAVRPATARAATRALVAHRAGGGVGAVGQRYFVVTLELAAVDGDQ